MNRSNLAVCKRATLLALVVASLSACGGGGGNDGEGNSTPAPTSGGAQTPPPVSSGEQAPQEVADAYPLIATPKVQGPLPNESFTNQSKNYTFFASDIALASVGYKEEEFYMEGKAKVYDTGATVPVTPIPGSSAPTKNAEIIASDIPYKTRFVVRRPVDPAKFNGTVVVEWLNVTDGFDGEYFWVQAKDHLLRDGYAYVGVTAQNNAISNATLGLKQFSPARYGSLDVTGNGTITQDALSFDIYSQAVKAARALPNVMGGMPVKRVIAAGMSQSGGRMGTYANYIHLRAPIVDAILIQVSNPLVRDDLPTPLIKVLSESEANATNLANTQPDTSTRRTWWVASTAHGDAIQRIGRTAVRLRDLGPAKTGNDNCLNGTVATRTRTPFSHVVSAAVFHLNRQVQTGAVPPRGAQFQRAGTTPETVARDVYGNVLGGIRLAAAEVPVARADGIQCGNIGAWEPFTDAQIASLYPTHADYVTKVNTAVQMSVSAGFVLPEDGAKTVAAAQSSLYGKNLKCGPLCLSINHFRADYSSTGLLRDYLAYYNVVKGEDLMQAVDEAHQWVAASDTDTGAAAIYDRNFAVAALERFTFLTERAASEGRLTSTAAQVLVTQANTIITGLK